MNKKENNKKMNTNFYPDQWFDSKDFFPYNEVFLQEA